MQEDISSWEFKYDSEIGLIDHNIAKLSEDRDSLMEKLAVLQARKKVENDEEWARQEALELDTEMAKQKKALLRRQNLAACKIQKEMQSYLKRRKELEALNPGKKGGGGKKGKKK